MRFLRTSTLVAVAICTLLVFVTAGFLWKRSRQSRTLRTLGSTVSINTKDLHQTGISLVASTDPDFDALVTSNVPVEARDNVEALKSTSAFLRNDTNHSLIAYTAKWELTTADGKVKTETRDYLAPDALMGRKTDDLTGVIQPNSIRLVSLAPVVEASGHPGVGGSAGSSRDDLPLARYVESLRGRVASSTAITISLDSILFDDGRFVGPDTAHKFEKISAIIQAKRDLLSDFERSVQNGKSLTVTFDGLTEVANAQKSELGSKPTRDDYYNFHKQLMAKELLALRHHFGEDEAAKRILNVLHRPWPELKKEN